MAKGFDNVLGWILLVIGIIGFAFNGFLGMHLNAAHSIVLIVTGLLSLYFGRQTASYSASKTWGIVAGLVYGIISLIGLFAGPGTTTVSPVGPTHNLLTLIPGTLEFGTGDNWWQLLCGVLFLIGAFSKETRMATTTASQREREAVTH